MTDYDNIEIKCEGMLEIDTCDYDSQLYAKQAMLNKELERFNSIDQTVSNIPTNIIITILDDITNNLDIQNPSHNMTCHSKAHGSTGGGTGFGKSYSKRC